MNAWTKHWHATLEKVEDMLGKVEDMLGTDETILWVGAFLRSSAVSLVLLSLFWIALEFIFTGVRTENGIDTIIAFAASFAIGSFYATNAVKKEKINEITKMIARQNNAIAEQTETIKKLWAMKKPR